MFSLESNFFYPQGAVAERLHMYEGKVESLDVLVPERRRETPGAVRLASNVLVHPVRKGSKMVMTIRLIRAGIRLGRSYDTTGGPIVVTSQDPFELGFVAYVVARVLNAPLHLQVHTDIGSPYFAQESLRRRMQVFLARFLLKRTDAVRVVSSRIKKSIETLGALPDRTSIVPIVVDWKKIEQKTPTIELKQHYPKLDPIILVASRLSREKNIALAIRAFAALLAQYPNAGLVIVGEGKEEGRLKQEVERQGLTEHVVFEGWSDDVTSYMKTADVFLLTSDYEGWGMSIIEAAASRVPVVMTDVGCAGEFMISGESALVVPVRDEKALANALIEILSSPEKQTKLAEAAYQRLSLIHDQSSYEQAVLNSYSQAIRNHETSHSHTESR